MPSQKQGSPRRLLTAQLAAEEVEEISKLLSRQPKYKYKSLWDSIRKQFLNVHADTHVAEIKKLSTPPTPFLLCPLSLSSFVSCGDEC